MTPEKAKATYGYRAGHPSRTKKKAKSEDLDHLAAVALREAIERATERTSGLVPVVLAPYEAEAVLWHLKRAGWQIVKDTNG